MPKELSSYSPYKYERDDTKERLTYVFETDRGLKYEVYFIKCKGDFIQEHLDKQTYTFGFGPSEGQEDILKSNNPKKKTPPFDRRIMDTVIDVLCSIIKEDKDIALLFICSDDLEISPKVRNKLFSEWLRLIEPSKLFGIEVFKWDIILSAEKEDENDEYMSLLVRGDNKYYKDFWDEYTVRADEADSVNRKRDL